MTPEQRGPDYIPFSVWLEQSEAARKRKSWLAGVATVIVVVVAGSILVRPILQRRAALVNLAATFREAGQVITTEERIAPDGTRRDRVVFEQDGAFRRTDLEAGKVSLFSSPEDPKIKFDRGMQRVMAYTLAPVRGDRTPFDTARNMVAMATPGNRSPFPPAEYRNGLVYLRVDSLQYVIHPGSGDHIATVEVQTPDEDGFTTTLEWQFDRAPKNLARMKPKSYTSLREEAYVPFQKNLKPLLTFPTSEGQASLLRVDVNERGELFIASLAPSPLEITFSGSGGRVYSTIPSQLDRMVLNREYLRGICAHAVDGVPLRWPLSFDVSIRVKSSPASAPFVKRFMFDKPTCFQLPEWEFMNQFNRSAYEIQHLRGILMEAWYAETGQRTLILSHDEPTVVNPARAVLLYREATTYFASGALGGLNVDLARVYYSLYRSYRAAGNLTAARATLKFANDVYSGADPWLAVKLAETMQIEGMIEIAE